LSIVQNKFEGGEDKNDVQSEFTTFIFVENCLQIASEIALNLANVTLDVFVNAFVMLEFVIKHF